MQQKHLPGNEMSESNEYDESDEDNSSPSKYKNSKVMFIHVNQDFLAILLTSS